MSEDLCRECIRLGHDARRAGRLDDALAHYHAALTAEPDGAEANSVYGLMLLHLGRAGEAEAPLRRAVEISPSHAAFRMNLAQLFAQLGRLDEAERILKDATRLAPTHEAILRLQAEIFEAGAKWPALGQLAASWIQAHPQSAQA